MKKVKILFTIPNFITAGSGREMLNIIERIDKNIFEPTICVEQSGGALYDEIIAKGIPILVQNFMVHDRNGMIAITKQSRKLATGFKKHHFDIWQSFNWSSDFSEALIAKFAGAKYVYVKKNMNWNRAAWKVKSFLSYRIVARNASMLFHFFSPPYLRRKTGLIYGGVDVNAFKPQRDISAREAIKIPGNAFLVTCVAQLVRVKDQLTLVHAVKELKDVYVVLAGAARDDDYVAELYSQIQDHGLGNRVIMTGPVKDVNGLLNATDAFVLPTTNVGGHEEGCPVSILEAMSAGVPCIASLVAGNRDLVTTNETGLLFKVGNAEELKACIEKYKSEPDFARQMADKAREQVLKEYTLDIEAATFNTLYKQMVRIA